MSLAKVEKKLKNHDGTCPVCREHTWVESERTRWLGEGEIQLQIMCHCGFEFYATCKVWYKKKIPITN